MKAALLLIAVFCVCVNSQVPVPAPVPVPVPVPLGLGLGLGLGGFGPFGLGGFGPFGLGLGGFGLGFGRFGLGLGIGRFGLLGRRFGRSASQDLSSVWVNQNRTLCRFDVEKSVIRCEGQSNIECGVEARLDEIRNITVRLPGLSVFPDVIRVAGQRDIPVLRLLSRVIGDATLIQPRTDRRVILSVYSSPSIQLPGFFIKDAKCFERFEGLVNTGLESVRFSLIAPMRA